MDKKKRRRVRLKALPFFPLNAISLVDQPAIEQDFLLFSADPGRVVMVRQDEERHELTGPAMIPEKVIPRLDPTTNEVYEVYFDEETVRNSMVNYMRAGQGVSLHHAEEAEDVRVVESWIVQDPENDKAKALGYDVPKGTWMVTLKVANPSVWALAKSGVVRGFSIEGMFVTVAEEMMRKNNNEDMMKFEKARLKDGTDVYHDGALSVGTKLYLDEEMTLAAPDGDHVLEDGTTITVASGEITAVTVPVQDSPSEESTETPAEAPAEAPSVDVAQVMAMIEDLTARVMALEDELTKSAEARQAAEQQLSVAMSRIETLEKQPAGRSFTVGAEIKREDGQNPFLKVARRVAR